MGLGPLNVRRDGSSVPQVFTGEFVSGNYFRMWGVSAVAGRALAPRSCARGGVQALRGGLIGAIEAADPNHLVLYEPTISANPKGPMIFPIPPNP